MPASAIRSGLLTVVLMVVPCVAFAQQVAKKWATLDDVDAAKVELKAEVAKLREDLKGDLAKLTDQLGKLADNDKSQNDTLSAIGKVVTSQDESLRKLRQDMDKQLDILRSQQGELREIVEAISTRDRTSGAPILDVAANMRSNDFREAMRGAVDQSMERNGTLEIENRLPGSYTMKVNGVYYQVPAYGTRTVSVPVGTATTELLGYESPKNWTIAPPTYRQRVIIGPSERVTYYRPLERMVYSDPVEPLVYGGWWEWVWNPWLGLWERRYVIP